MNPDFEAERPAAQESTDSLFEELVEGIVEVPQRDHRYEFIFCNPTSENASGAVEVLQSCDVIAYSVGGVPPGEVPGLLRMYNTLLDSKTDPETTFAITNQLDRQLQALPPSPVRTEKLFTLRLLEELLRTGKLVLPIDLDASTEGGKGLEKVDRATVDFWAAIDEDAPTEQLQALATAAVEATAQSALEREQTIAQQLLDMQALTGSVEGDEVKIGVVLPAIYTPTYHQLHHSHQAVGRVFVDRRQTEPVASNYTFPYFERAVREKRFFPDREVNQQLIDRFVVNASFAPFGPEGDDEAEVNAFLQQIQEGVVEQMSDEDVATFLATLDELKQQFVNDPDEREESIKALIDATFKRFWVAPKETPLGDE